MKLFIFFVLVIMAQQARGDNSTSPSIVNNNIPDILPRCIFGVSGTDIILYSRSNMNGLIVQLNDTNIPIDVNVQSIFLVHGFISEANNSDYVELASAILNKTNVNILSVDWREAACNGAFTLTEFIGYPSAVANTKVIGEYIANFTVKLINEYNLDLERTMIVGHSLGAHISGFASKSLMNLGYQGFPRITGLDPAGPGFTGSACSERLCETDANFVDIYHTSIIGVPNAIGDVDFFFNGFANQPGCGVDVSCSHSRSIEYLTESISNPSCKFVGREWDPARLIFGNLRCDDYTCTAAGPEAALYPARGSFLVTTNSRSPYCRGSSDLQAPPTSSQNGTQSDGSDSENPENRCASEQNNSNNILDDIGNIVKNIADDFHKDS